MQSLLKTRSFLTKALSNSSRRYISVGDEIPTCNLKIVEFKNDDYHTSVLDARAAFQDQKVILIGYPGAFTPSCEGVHLPEFIKNAPDLLADGIDKIYAMAVNDPFVVAAFARKLEGDENVSWIADGNGDFAKALNVGVDLKKAGLGARCRRFTMIIENNKVIEFNDEKGPEMTDLSRVHTVLSQIKRK